MRKNPALNISKALAKVSKTQEHRKALPYTAVSGRIEAVNASRAGRATKLALEYLVLTAPRSGEVKEAHRDEIDMAAKVREVPAGRMKMSRPHQVSQSSRAIAVPNQAEALGDDSGLVFPGTKKGRSLLDMALSKLVKELGFKADVHGFRASFRTWAQERTSFPREVAEAALAHPSAQGASCVPLSSSSFPKEKGDELGEALADHHAKAM